MPRPPLTAVIFLYLFNFLDGLPKEFSIYDTTYAGVHSGPGFFPWHREYLKRFELVLRTFLPMGSTLGLPYWDSTLDAYLPTVEDSVFFSVHLTGDVDEDGLLVYGPYANMSTMEGNLMPRRALGNNSQGELFTEARIDVLLDQKEIEGVLQYPLDERFFEFSHDYVHYFIGGDFETTYSSTNDVIFFWHHTFVDFIWEMWRQKIQTREEREVQYPEPYPDCFPPLHFANATMHNLPGRKIQDGLLNAYTDKMYKIASRPRCSNARPDCGSKYLFCDTANFDRPRCQSKVKFGGNCTGYEAFDICYEGSCYDGRCQALPSLRLNEIYYDKKFEIQLDNLKLGRIIGDGHFGKVCMGWVLRPKGPSDGPHSHISDMLPVAVKAPKHNGNHDEMGILYEELKIMSNIPKHPNILTLVGAVTNFDLGEIYVILERCEGSLIDKLKEGKARFRDELVFSMAGL
ncbi:unnamed protein product, partial [Mesorhabditis spiculigera]